MAAVTKSANIAMDTVSGSKAGTISGKVAGEAIAKGDACYIKGSDGKIYKSINTAVNEAANVMGFAADGAAINEAVTLYSAPSIWEYSDALLTPGALLYLGAVAGGLDTAPGTGHPTPVAHAVDTQRLRVVVHV
jgi:hypothetical protein